MGTSAEVKVFLGMNCPINKQQPVSINVYNAKAVNIINCAA